MQPNYTETYLQEAQDLLAEIETATLALSQDGSDGESVHRIFRAFHTIKGAGAMVGYDKVAAFAHHVESLLDQVREHTVAVSERLCGVILASADHLKLLLQGLTVDADAQEALLQQIRRLAAPNHTKIDQTKINDSKINDSKTDDSKTDDSKTWRIYFRPDPGLLARGGNPLLILRDLAGLGECVVEGEVNGLPPLGEMQTDVCYVAWNVVLKTSAGAGADAKKIREVFLFVEDGSELRIEPVDAPAHTCDAAPAPQSAPAVEKSAPAPPQASQSFSRETTVRVPAERLDRLVTLVGELVMNQGRLATAAARFQAPELAAPVEEIERLVAELRDDVLQIRMMPICTIFGRFRRLVHDLSQQLDKEIDLVTEGEDTELDKTILDLLGEPLVHLLRNSIDHGIESAEVRASSGKPRKGTIRLIASYRGSDVVISIADDGAGLDRAAIRAKAIARQIIAKDANLNDEEILNLILLPGFSTAQVVTNVSGRGVGMDVVKRQIDALRGSLRLSSEPGKGTTVSLTLPLTLAIIDGLLVEAGDNQYIIPMALVTENVEISRAERAHNNGRNMIAVRGELIPYIDLRETFQIAGASSPIGKIVLTRHGEHRIGILVDRVLGTHQTVVQALGRFLRKIRVISGSTVMGDGRVALILDIAGVLRLAEDRLREQMAA